MTLTTKWSRINNTLQMLFSNVKTKTDTMDKANEGHKIKYKDTMEQSLVGNLGRSYSYPSIGDFGAVVGLLSHF